MKAQRSAFSVQKRKRPRRILSALYILNAVFFLAACAQPVTQIPAIHPDEVAHERVQQRQLAHATVRQPYEELSYSKRERVAMQEKLQKLVDRLAPEATTLCRELNGPGANCDMHIELANKIKGVNAAADGEKILISPAMVDFAKSDTHLAMVLAHEYTHHMMGHVGATRTNMLGGALMGTMVDVLAARGGTSTGGQFGKLGASAALLTYSPDFEYEADYIGLYMLARAGFPIEEASAFWRQMARYNPQGIYNRTTHPTTPERFVLLEKTVEEIKQKQAAGQKLLPNLLPQDG